MSSGTQAGSPAIRQAGNLRYEEADICERLRLRGVGSGRYQQTAVGRNWNPRQVGNLRHFNFGGALGTARPTFGVGEMNALEQSWWPTRLLRKHPLKEVCVCGRQLEPPVSSHVVNFPRLELPLTGCYENHIERGGSIGTLRLTPGMALFAPPNCWNLPTWRQPVSVMSLLFGKKQLGVSIVSVKAAGKPLLARKFSQPLPVTGVFPKVLDAMLEVQIENASQAVLTDLARALLTCVEQRVLAPAETETHPTKSLLEDVCVYLQNHYQHDISRDSVARQFNISPNYLSRIFQVQGHMTFSNYLMHVRTDRAKHLLTSYDLKLADVAARCGYRDLAYFCRVFRKLAKMTPTDYREYRKREQGGNAAPKGTAGAETM